MPIRMCIVCRDRYEQIELLRLQYKEGDILKFQKINRSFYICSKCLHNEKNLTKKLSYFLKIPKDKSQELATKIKEFSFD
jgi:predicted RNA-binding protein YlxR (DUF448 family)